STKRSLVTWPTTSDLAPALHQHHAAVPGTSVAADPFELRAAEGQVDAVAPAALVGQYRVVQGEVVVVEAGDYHPVRRALGVEPVARDQHDRYGATLDGLDHVVEAEVLDHLPPAQGPYLLLEGLVGEADDLLLVGVAHGVEERRP